MVQYGLSYMKNRYPAFQYVEVWNEPGGNWPGKIPVSTYKLMYQQVVSAVKAEGDIAHWSASFEGGWPHHFDSYPELYSRVPLLGKGQSPGIGIQCDFQFRKLGNTCGPVRAAPLSYAIT